MTEKLQLEADLAREQSNQAIREEYYQNVYEREVWNRAIEAAAKLVDNGFYPHEIGNEIRELKK